MTVKTVEQTIAQIKKEILADIRWCRVPVTVTEFSDLHDHVDANCYGGLCDDETADEMIAHYGGRDAHEGMPEGMLDHINAAFGAIDGWLHARGHHEALKGVYEDEHGRAFDLMRIEGEYAVICPEGGGFVYKPPAENFFNSCKLRVDKPKVRAFITSLDGLESTFTAYSSGYRWNGWAVPWFEKTQLLEVITLLSRDLPLGQSEYVRFNEELDAAEYYDEGEQQWFQCNPEEIEVQMESGMTVTLKLYPLGDGWCWNFLGWWSDLK